MQIIFMLPTNACISNFFSNLMSDSLWTEVARVQLSWSPLGLYILEYRVSPALSLLLIPPVTALTAAMILQRSWKQAEISQAK